MQAKILDINPRLQSREVLDMTVPQIYRKLITLVKEDWRTARYILEEIKEKRPRKYFDLVIYKDFVEKVITPITKKIGEVIQEESK